MHILMVRPEAPILDALHACPNSRGPICGLRIFFSYIRFPGQCQFCLILFFLERYSQLVVAWKLCFSFNFIAFGFFVLCRHFFLQQVHSMKDQILTAEDHSEAHHPRAPPPVRMADPSTSPKHLRSGNLAASSSSTPCLERPHGFSLRQSAQ